MKRTLIIFLMTILAVTLLASEPVSKEANIIQRYANGDVEIQAVGIYNSSASSTSKKKTDIKNNGIAKATEDAKKAAIYYLIHSAPDPILVDGEARARFTTRGSFIFEPASLNRLVTYVNPDNSYAVKLNNDTTQKITKIMRVNRNAIIRDLTNAGIFEHGYAASNDALDRLETETDKIPVATPSTPVRDDPFARLDAQTGAVGVAGNVAPATPTERPITSSEIAPRDSRMSAFKESQAATVTTATVQTTLNDLCQNIPAGSTIALLEVRGDNAINTIKNETYDAISSVLASKGYQIIPKSQMSVLVPSDRAGNLSVDSIVSISNVTSAAFIFDTSISDRNINIQCINTRTRVSTNKAVRY